MPSSVKLVGNPEWFEFAQVESSKLSSLRSTGVISSKKSVILGQKLTEPETVSILPSKLSLTELLQYQGGIIAKQILTSNTFFHGKVGFYEFVMRRVFAATGKKHQEIKYLFTIQNLPRENKPAQLILLPNVKSEEALNDLVAQSLRHKSKAPVWLVANPASIHRHLLLGFHNFFITSNNPDEIKHLQNVFSLPKITVDLLLSNEKEAVFITDFEIVVKNAYPPIAIVRIDKFD
jgi:hypothetical protein